MRIRKNAAKLPQTERRRYVDAVKALKQDIVRTLGNGTQVSRYDEFVALHLGVTRRFDNQTPIGDGAHNTPAFLPWHRQYLLALEDRLREVDLGVTIPYWEWTDSAGTRDVIFQDDFMGPRGTGPLNEVRSGDFAQSAGWELIDEIHRPRLGFVTMGLNDPLPGNTRGNELRRNSSFNFAPRSIFNPAGLPTPNRINTVLGRNIYEDLGFQRGFREDLEGDPHGSLHPWTGGASGTMSAMSSPKDPIFFLHHSAVDWIWARWQDDGHAGPGFYPDNVPGAGHALNSAMWPWDGGQATTHSVILPYFDSSFGGTVRPADVLDSRALDVTYDTLLPELEIGQPASNVALNGSGDEQGFQFVVRDTGRYRVEKQGATSVKMGLYGPDSWALVVQSEGSGMLTRVADLVPGTYYVVVRPSDSVSAGTFTLTLSQEDGIPVDPPSLPLELIVDGPAAQANIGIGGETDVYRFSVPTFGQYGIETQGPTDVVMTLYGPNDRNSLVTSDDDSGDERNARISAALTAGTYHVEVQHFFPSGTGLYAISVRMEAEASATVLEIDGTEVQGEISAADESDLYVFQISGAGMHIVETSGITDTFLTLLGPNSETTVIARDDDSGPGLLSRIEANLPAGEYFVRVRHFSPSGTGLYGVRVRRA